MANVVYWTTNIKPGDAVVVANGLRLLTVKVTRKEIVGQKYVGTPPRGNEEGNRAAAFRLTDAGMELYRDGISAPPEGFHVWPEDVPEPTDFESIGEIGDE